MAGTDSKLLAALRKFDIWHVVLALPWFALAIRSGVAVRDNSYLWHVTAGRVQIDLGSVITVDPFSFTRGGEPWRTQSWLAELLYSWLDDRFELVTVPVLVVVLSTVALVAMLITAHQISRSLQVTAVIAVLSVDLLIAFLNPRPVIFSFALFAIFVLAERQPSLRWTLPLLFWVWASVHGSFVIGGVYLVLSAIRERRRSAMVDVAACSAAALLTAHGWGVIDMLIEFSRSREGLDTISEWVAPDLLAIPTIPLLIAIFFFMWAAHAGRLESRDFIIIVPFILLGLTANRAVPPAWIALVPMLAHAGRDLRLKPRVVSPVRGFLHATILVALVAIPLVGARSVGLEEGRFPVEASRHLSSARVFHDDAAGGYLIYSQWPARQVYVDDRAELYKGMLVTFAETRGGKPVWREVFDEFEIDEVMLRADAPLLEILRASGWRQTYGDDGFEIFVEP